MNRLFFLAFVSFLGCGERTVYITQSSALLSGQTTACDDGGGMLDATTDSGPIDSGSPPPDSPTDAGSQTDALTSACLANNNGVGCSGTEQLFAASRSVDCYNCLVNAGCVDDAVFGDTGHECEDVAGTVALGAFEGQSRTNACLQTVNCILQSRCATAVDNSVVTCFCGGLSDTQCSMMTTLVQLDGGCSDEEQAALEHPSNQNASEVLGDFYNTLLGGAMANLIFECASVNQCGSCF